MGQTSETQSKVYCARCGADEAQMNFSEFVEKLDNGTITPVVYHVDPERARIRAFRLVFLYVCVALGIPGNILSAIVWLRLHKKNSSAVYLAALAINDLAQLLIEFTYSQIGNSKSWLYYCVVYLFLSPITIEPLLVLGFSVERLLAICWPLRVYFYDYALQNQCRIFKNINS